MRIPKDANTLRVCMALFLLSLLGCSSDSTEEPTPEEVFRATFRITGDGYNDTLSFNSQDNLLFCRDLGNGEMWIRLASEQAANGQNGPHIDIDICGFGGSGSYTPMEAGVRPCPSGANLWAIFWHDSPEKIYANGEASTPCNLILTQEGNRIRGTFNCEGLDRREGGGNVTITQGSFECSIE